MFFKVSPSDEKNSDSFIVTLRPRGGRCVCGLCVVVYKKYHTKALRPTTVFKHNACN